MVFFKLLVLVSFLQIYHGSILTIEMIRHRLIPLYVRQPPMLQCEVTYGTGYRLIPGEELTRKEVDHEPNVTWPAENNAYYCLCMSGFSLWPILEYLRKDTYEEIENGTVSNQWQNWLVGNIPGNRLHEGEVLAEYREPEIPPISGNHCYIFIVYKQPGWINFTRRRQPATEGLRGFFSVSWFAKRHKLGVPIAANFYRWNDPDLTPVPYIPDKLISTLPFGHGRYIPDESRPRMRIWTKLGQTKGTTNRRGRFPTDGGKTTFPYSF